ncbi:MAG: anthranilate phosphoribosyltransferase, partial [Desulfosarcina sp.]
MFREYLATIIGRTDLSESQMAEMMSDIFDGNTTDAQVGAMMAALAT